jgi:hypothetical protein
MGINFKQSQSSLDQASKIAQDLERLLKQQEGLISGTKAAAAVTRMNVSQSREEFTRAAREFQKNMILGMEIAQRRAGGLSPGAQDALNAVMGGRR